MFIINSREMSLVCGLRSQKCQTASSDDYRNTDVGEEVVTTAREQQNGFVRCVMVIVMCKGIGAPETTEPKDYYVRSPWGNWHPYYLVCSWRSGSAPDSNSYDLRLGQRYKRFRSRT